MEKILLALDRRQINMNTVEFACYLARLTSSALTVAFLQEKDGEPASGSFVKSSPSELFTRSAAMENKLLISPAQDDLVDFQSMCLNRGVRISIHENEDQPFPEIISDSRFSDLLVVDPEMSFGNRREAVPTGFIKEVLAYSECPVVIAPYSFNGIHEIVFAYDGSASATFAMKQFAYLFPELTDLKLTILQVSEERNVPLIEKKKLIEFLQTHFSSIGFRILEGNAREELFKYLLNKKDVFVVMGAFGRKNFASLFRHSTADTLLKTVNLPLFITHKD